MKRLGLLKMIGAVVFAGLLTTAVSAADKKEKAKAYPLETCIVSDEKLDSMGEPYVFTHEGQEVKLCCKSCLKDFKKDSAKYLKKLEKADKKKSK
jgi:Archaeal TRASH domain